LQLEQQGIQATFEVQQAARKVARENQQLRELLASLGISNEDVNNYLRVTNARGANKLLGLPTRRLRSIADFHTAGINAEGKIDSVPTPSHRSDPYFHPSSSYRCPDKQMHNHSVQSPPKSLSGQHELTGDNISESGAAPSAKSLGTKTTGLDTSCEEAAAIIATMRGHGDQEQARYELGCDVIRECRIKNTSLLEAMDA